MCESLHTCKDCECSGCRFAVCGASKARKKSRHSGRDEYHLELHMTTWYGQPAADKLARADSSSDRTGNEATSDRFAFEKRCDHSWEENCPQ